MSYIDGSTVNNYILPQKYHMFDNSANYMKSSGTGANGFFLNRYAINYGVSTFRLSASHNNFSENVVTTSAMYELGYNHNNFESYERCVFALYNGNYTTRSRVYRPIGFDPENYWGFWEPSQEQPCVSSGNSETVEQDEQVLNYCFGFHNLAQSSAHGGPNLYAKANQENKYSPAYAIKELRNLGAYQMTEKANLVEMQKPINFPAIILNIRTKSTEKNSSTLYVTNNFIYSTYLSNAFPATQDNIFLNRYFNLAFQRSSILTIQAHAYQSIKTSDYSCESALTPSIVNNNKFMNISGNKTASHTLDSTALELSNSFLNLESDFTPTGKDDDNCPPYRLADNGTYWALDHYVTRISGNHYNFIYDRNRAKWIQLVDIDIGALKTKLEALDIWNNGTVMPIVCVNSDWQGLDATKANKNYLCDGVDIRYKYSTNRATFFTNYADGSYVYPNNGKPVIDIGIRLINASTLPERGLTFYCPYPLYIKGNFNHTSPKPALIITDSITILPVNWQDWRSQMDPIKSHIWYGPPYLNSSGSSDYRAHPYCGGINIHADIITGRTHPHFWIQSADTTTGTNQTVAPNPDMGIHDAFRSLCDYTNRTYVYGSLMLPYYCQEQWEPPIDFCKTDTINPINYAYLPIKMFPRADVGIPAAMPFYYRINRGRKTQCIGERAYVALKGNTLYNKDWSLEANTFSDYHTALPNYLKYEEDPE